jgi:uridylate kinase
MEKKAPFRRVLLKLSGETILGSQSFGVNPLAVQQVASYLQSIHEANIELGVVIGGGNIFRGIDLKTTGMPKVPADHMGMLATILNGIALQQALIEKKIPVCLMSALECPKVAESYNWMNAVEYLQKGTVVIFVGGTGNSSFTTDTAAALRAVEIDADVLLKATKVDGIYNKDPLKHSDAIKYDCISYSQILAEQLKVMDGTAVALCRSSSIPIYVFNMQRLVEEPIHDVFTQIEKGTWVNEEGVIPDRGHSASC